MFSKLTKIFAVVLFSGGVVACAENHAVIPLDLNEQPTVKEVSLMVNRNLVQFMASQSFKIPTDEHKEKPKLYIGEITSDVGFINVIPELVKEQISKRLEMTDNFILVTNNKEPHDYDLTGSFTLYSSAINVNYDYRILIFKLKLLNLHNNKTVTASEVLRRHRGSGLWE